MSYDMQNDGPLVIEQSTGTVIEGISVDSLNDVGVAISTRDPANPADPALKNTRIVKVATLPANMTDRALFPVPALDNAGNLYVIWVTRSDELAKDNSKAWQIWYSWSKKSSNWTEWSDPIQVSQPPSNTNVMPWATAGSGGRLAVVWYGTDDDSHNPSTEGAHQKWDVYLNVITNAASNSPKLHQQKVTRHPMHYGTVCLEGTGCIAVQGNRNVADFFEVVTDPRTGRIAVVYDDTSNDITQTVANGQQVGDSAADHKGAPLVTVALQNGGIGLLGKRIHGPPRGGTKMRDRKDDATWDPIYGADTVPQLDLRNVSIKRMKKSFRVKLKVGQLSDFNTALTTTGSVAMNYVVRWSGKKKTAEGIKNPIYYAAAEATAGDSVQYYAGDAFTYELCSVSGCFPHGFLYPAPPLGGTAIKGKLVDKKGKKPDLFKLKIPFSVVGKRKLLESFSAYAIASPRSAGTPPSNSEAEADRMPVLVDGICCRDAKPRLRRRH
jgi:hypothetical protein